jgi:uroporphyrinogen decarboxylase
VDGHAADLLGERVTMQTPENDLILRALRGERTERTPVWLMRQAGRFDPAYRELRENAGLELEELFAHPRYAAEITCLPGRFGVDAAILFQDILTPLGPMGAPFVFRPGPVCERPVRSAADAARLEAYDPAESLDFVFESIALTLDRLAGRVPLLGFAGAPLTLLAFMTAGGSPGDDGSRLLSFLRDEPEAAEALLARIAEVTARYLRLQIEAGVHAAQLFESSAPLLDRETYEQWALPFQQRVFGALAGVGVPLILFAKDTDPALMAMSGADAISVGTSTPLGEARAAMPGKAIQGNVDNELLRDGTPEAVRAAAVECIRAGGHDGHVLNLGHGVLKETPVDNVRAMIDAARETVLDEARESEGAAS